MFLLLCCSFTLANIINVFTRRPSSTVYNYIVYIYYIWTVNSCTCWLMPTFLILFKLVYGPFGQLRPYCPNIYILCLQVLLRFSIMNACSVFTLVLKMYLKSYLKVIPTKTKHNNYIPTFTVQVSYFEMSSL